ncbi:MAG: hypothetical protein K0R60_11 [Microbacterium sp.]|jgi:hypothetical protein|nr:hypothetical protein [Microbacterium sp.]
MLQDYYGGFPVAYNPDTEELVREAAFEVYAADDLAFASPLAITDPATGTPIATLRSTADGVLRDFRVAGDPTQVLIKSGSFVTRLTSLYGTLRDAGFDPDKVDQAVSAVEDAEAARDIAVAARTAVEGVVATNDGIMAAVASDDDSAFAIQQKATIAGKVQGATTPIEEFVRALDMRDPRALTIAIAADSTSDSSSEWFETMWREILRERWPERPAQVYRFSNTTNTYPAVIPIQSGDNSLGMLTIYNASYAGGTLSTQRTYFNVMFPVAPEVLFISHGHNYTVDAAAYLADIDAFVDDDMAAFAPFSVVLFSQNPEFAQGGVTAGQVTQHAERQRALREHAVSCGWGYIPGFEAFSQRGDGGLSLMQPSDGKHPTLAVQNPTVETGARVQAEAARRWITSQSRRNYARAYPDLIVNGYDHLYHADKLVAAGAEPAAATVIHSWWDQAPATELMSDASGTTGGATVTEESGVRFVRIDTPPAAALGTAWNDTAKPRTMVYLVRMPQLTVNFLQTVGYRIRRITGGNWELSNGTDTITVAGDSDWSVVVAVLDGANSKLNVEGVEVAASTAFAPGAIVTTGITIGTGSATDYSPLDLRMIVSYPRALTASEIATLRAQIRAKNPTLGLAA